MNMTTTSRFVRVAGWIGVFGVAGFCVGIVLAGLAFPGYSHVDQMISELGGVEAPHAWIQNANFLLFGACVITLALGLMVDAGRVFPGAVLLGVLGLSGTFAEGVAHCDAGCEGATTEGAIHLGFGMVGFLCGVVALFVLARRWRKDARWQTHAAFTRVCAWASLAGLLLFMGSDGAPEIDGLAQRLFVAPLLVFLAGTGWRMAHASVADREPELLTT